jgi:hypothetical protein
MQKVYNYSIRAPSVNDAERLIAALTESKAGRLHQYKLSVRLIGLIDARVSDVCLYFDSTLNVRKVTHVVRAVWDDEDYVCSLRKYGEYYIQAC